jgi:hypothetical protein
MALPNITEVLLEGRNIALNWYKWFEEVARTKVDWTRRVDAGTGLQGGGDLKQDLSISIADIAGLVAGEYGDATHIPVVTVNAQGQVIAIAVVDLGSSTDPGALQIANNLSDLGNLTTAQTNLGLVAVALSGSYADLTGVPTISAVGHTGNYSDLIGVPTISTVGHTGNYSDLIGAPALASVATSGSASDLTTGTLAVARLPALTGDVTAAVGTGVTVIGAGKVATAMVQDDAITLAKLANMTTASFLGRNTALTGDPEVLSIATVKTMLDLTGTNSGDQTITLTGDVTGSGTGSFAATIGALKVATGMIQANAVTLAKMAQMATASFLGRNTALTGDPEVLSVATAKTMLGLAGSNTGDQTITLTGDVTGSGTGSFATTIGALKVATGMVQNSAITLAKMADMATASFIGRNTAATGVPEILSIATAKTMLGLAGSNTGDQTITLTGDVTGSGTGSFAATIAANAVTLAKMAQMATASILGRTTAATGNVEVLTATQARGVLGLATTDGPTFDNLRVTTTTLFNGLTLKCTEDSATNSPIIVLTRVTASPAVNDVIGAFQFNGCTDTSLAGGINYAGMSVILENITNGSESSSFRFTSRRTAVGTEECRFGNGVTTQGGLSGQGVGTFNGSAYYAGSTVVIDSNRIFRLRSYTVATLPSASPAAQLIYVSDGTSNKRLAVSDGTNWRWPDGVIVS